MKYWNALTDEAQDAILVIGLLLECYVLFGLIV
jgi:hypothetical protein